MTRAALTLVQTRQSTFAITTPTAVAAARGTDYVTVFNLARQSTTVVVLEEGRNPAVPPASPRPASARPDRTRTCTSSGSPPPSLPSRRPSRGVRGIRRIGALSLIGLVLLTAAPAVQAQGKAATATITQVTGRVQTLRLGQTNWAPATVGGQLGERDEIRALAGGSAVLRVPDGSTLVLAENSRLVITKLEVDAQRQTRNGIFHLVVGKVRAVVAEAALILVQTRQSNFAITTPTAVAAARGTDYVVVFNLAQASTAKPRRGRGPVLRPAHQGRGGRPAEAADHPVCADVRVLPERRAIVHLAEQPVHRPAPRTRTPVGNLVSPSLVDQIIAGQPPLAALGGGAPMFPSLQPPSGPGAGVPQSPGASLPRARRRPAAGTPEPLGPPGPPGGGTAGPPGPPSGPVVSPRPDPSRSCPVVPPPRPRNAWPRSAPCRAGPVEARAGALRGRVGQEREGVPGQEVLQVGVIRHVDVSDPETRTFATCAGQRSRMKASCSVPWRARRPPTRDRHACEAGRQRPPRCRPSRFVRHPSADLPREDAEDLRRRPAPKTFAVQTKRARMEPGSALRR